MTPLWALIFAWEDAIFSIYRFCEFVVRTCAYFLRSLISDFCPFFFVLSISYSNIASRGCINKRNVTNFFNKTYYAYFSMKLGNKEKKWAQYVVCYTYVELLWKWTEGEIKFLSFAIQIIRPACQDGCYFCYRLRKVHGLFQRHYSEIFRKLQRS